VRLGETEGDSGKACEGVGVKVGSWVTCTVSEGQGESEGETESEGEFERDGEGLIDWEVFGEALLELVLAVEKLPLPLSENEEEGVSETLAWGVKGDGVGLMVGSGVR